MKKYRFIFVLALTLVVANTAFSEEVTRGSLSGKWITKNHGAMAGGLVLLFNTATGPPPTNEGHLRVPDRLFEIGPGGEFSVEVAAGSYYLVMRKGTSRRPGPPKDGDLFFFSLNEKGQPKTYTVKPGEVTDVGTITEALPFKWAVKPQDGSTTIEGTITDEKGMPVAGARVLAFPSPLTDGRPLYVSDSTGPDGNYVLRINEGGTYYLKIRSLYGGGVPEAGEIMGGYGEQAPAAVRVETGKKTTGIDIKGIRFAGRGPRQ